jgi:hypothetical protein
VHLCVCPATGDGCMSAWRYSYFMFSASDSPWLVPGTSGRAHENHSIVERAAGLSTGPEQQQAKPQTQTCLVVKVSRPRQCRKKYMCMCSGEPVNRNRCNRALCVHG